MGFSQADHVGPVRNAMSRTRNQFSYLALVQKAAIVTIFLIYI